MSCSPIWPGTTDALHDLTEQSLLGGYQSLSDYFPPQDNRDAALSSVQTLYGAAGLVHEELTLTEASRERLSRQVMQPERMSDEDVVRLAAGYFPHLWVGRMDDAYHAAIALFDPSPAVRLAELGAGRYVDVTQDWTEQLTQATQRAVVIFAVAVLLVGLVLQVWLRAWSSLAIALVPLTSGLTVLGVLTAMGIQITLFHVLGLYLVVGLGFDYGIFAWRDSGDDQRCYLAILLSALTTMLAFGLLGLSSTPMIAAFGLTVMCGTILNLLLVPGVRLFR